MEIESNLHSSGQYITHRCWGIIWRLVWAISLPLVLEYIAITRSHNEEIKIILSAVFIPLFFLIPLIRAIIMARGIKDYLVVDDSGISGKWHFGKYRNKKQDINIPWSRITSIEKKTMKWAEWAYRYLFYHDYLVLKRDDDYTLELHIDSILTDPLLEAIAHYSDDKFFTYHNATKAIILRLLLWVIIIGLAALGYVCS